MSIPSLPTAPFLDTQRAAEAYDLLRGQATGREPCATRARALVMLAESDAPSRVFDLADVLSDPSAPLSLRQLAASLLGRIDRASVRDVLVAALNGAGDRLTGSIAAALGRCGDREAMRALREVEKGLSGVPAQQVRFAIRLVAHRFDLDIHDLPPEEGHAIPACPGEEQRFSLRPADVITAQIAHRALARDPVGVEWNEKTASLIRCDGSLSVMFLNLALGARPDPSVLLQKKTIAGVIAEWSEATGAFNLHDLILTSPAGPAGAILLSVYRANGTLAFHGRGAVDGPALNFVVHGVARRGGRAAEARGTLTNGQVTLTRAFVGQLLHDVARPRESPLTLPSQSHR